MSLPLNGKVIDIDAVHIDIGGTVLSAEICYEVHCDKRVIILRCIDMAYVKVRRSSSVDGKQHGARLSSVLSRCHALPEVETLGFCLSHVSRLQPYDNVYLFDNL